MAEEKWVVQGFLFATKEGYIEAGKEAEAVAYIKANTQFKDIKQVVKLYNKLIDKNTFSTIIGYEFLQQLQQLIIKNKVLTEEEIRPIPIKKSETGAESDKKQLNAEKEAQKYKNLYEELKGKKSSEKVVIVFLLIIIIAMVAVVATSDKAEMINYENKIIDRYENWQHQLEEKEKQLEERENALQK